MAENVHMVLGLSSYYFYQLFRLIFFPGPIPIRIYILWAKLLMDFPTDHLETMHTFSTWSEYVRVVLGLSCRFVFNFFHFVFPGQISIRIDILWVQLLLEFFTDHFETMHTCSTWSEDVRVV